MAVTDPKIDGLAEALGSLSPRDTEMNHISVEELVSYYEEHLSPNRITVVQEHLTQCERCTTLLLDLVNFEHLGPKFGVAPEDEPDFVALKQTLDERLAALNPIQESLVLPEEGRPAPWLRPVYGSLMAAMLVALVSLGLLLRIAGSPRDLATEAFFLSDATYRGESESTLEVPPWAEVYVLTLGFEELVGRRVVTIEIHDSRGASVARKKTLNVSSDGVFRWSLDRERLAPGAYRLEIHSKEGTILKSFGFKVVLEESSG